RTFGIDPAGPARFNITRLGPVLEDIHDRLAGVMIENLPWAKFIERYDRKATLFYLDPPYWGCESDYGRDLFSPGDFRHLATVLKALKGRFILSLNDVSEVREVFANFTIEPVTLTYTVGGGKGRAAKEVIITNFGVNIG
ncbi:Site-specific DNA methylase, partial [hydrothermal vent metagenome]